MNNTKLLKDLIKEAQQAGNALRSNRFDEAKDRIDDVLVIAEMLSQSQLTMRANCVRDSFDRGFLADADCSLRTLIVNADRLPGRI